MLNYLDTVGRCEESGRMQDITFIDNEFWLQDTAVIENIALWRGEWSISLLFAHHLKPLRFIKRRIVSYSCQKKATLAAHYMRRQAAKDQRGTLYIDFSLYKINHN